METRDDVESVAVLLARLAQACARLQAERDDFQAENARLLRQLVGALPAAPGREDAIEMRTVAEVARYETPGLDDVVVSVDSEAFRPWSITLQECPVHAAPPPQGQSFNVGDRVEVRDGEAEAWKVGTVVSVAPVKVKPDCWTVDSSAKWEMIRGSADTREPPGAEASRRTSTRNSSSAMGSGPLVVEGSPRGAPGGQGPPGGSPGKTGNGHDDSNGQGPPGNSPGAASNAIAHEHVNQAAKNNNGHTAGSIKNYLRTELNQASACIQLPFALVLWATFALSVFFHTQNETLHATDRAFMWDIEENANFAFTGEIPFESGRMGGKNINDVNSFADFWSWFDFGLVPLFWAEGWDVRESRTNMQVRCMTTKEAMLSFGLGANELINMSSSDSYGRFHFAGGACPEGALAVQNPPTDLIGTNPKTPTYLYYNSVVGGMRMRQERIDTEECHPADKEVERSLHNGKCVKNRADGYWIKPELRRAYGTDEALVDRPGGETVYLLSGIAQTEVRRQIQALETRVWAGPQTGKIEMLYTTYNPHQDLLTATFIVFFVNHAGHIHKLVQPVSIWLHPYHDEIICYILDMLWILLIFKIVVDEAIDITSHWKQLGIVKGTRTYVSVSNMIDWVGVVYSVVVAVMWWLHLEDLEVLKAYMRQGSVGVVGTWEDASVRAGWFTAVKDATEAQYTFRIVISAYPFVIVSRFFKACASQPRLSLVTKTLQEAAVDIVHFGIVFAAVFVIYAQSAMILFGQELEDFANTGRSLTAVFRILLGDFDWEQMIQVGRMEAGIWFGSFMVMVNLIMLNMLLAIIMDVYTEVRGSVGPNAKTLWRQSYEVLHRYMAQRRGEVISLEAILLVLDPTSLDSNDDEDGDEAIPDNQVFTPKTLSALVEGMTEAQATIVLEAAAEHEGKDEGISLSALATKVVDIEEVTIETRDALMAHIMEFQTLNQAQRRTMYAGPGRARRDP